MNAKAQNKLDSIIHNKATFLSTRLSTAFDWIKAIMAPLMIISSSKGTEIKVGELPKSLILITL